MNLTPNSWTPSRTSSSRSTMSGTPSGAPPAAIMLSPEERIEALLQQIVADRAQDAARMDAMQATIDSSIDLAALHRAAAAGGPPTLALQGQAAGTSWLRRIVDTALQSPGGTALPPAAVPRPAAPAGLNSPAGATRPSALRAHFNQPNAPPPPGPVRGPRRIDTVLEQDSVGNDCYCVIKSVNPLPRFERVKLVSGQRGQACRPCPSDG